MVTQCAQGKKKNTINLYAGIFDNKLFRRGGKGHSESSSDFEKCRDDAVLTDRSHRPQRLSEDALTDKQATLGSKHSFVQNNDIAAKKSSQPHVIHEQGSLQYFAGVCSDLRGDAELQAMPDVGAAEFEKINSQLCMIDEHVNAGSLDKKSSTQHDMGTEKRSLENDDEVFDKIEYMSICSNAGHQWQDSRVPLFYKSLERTNLQGNRPQQAFKREEEDSTVGEDLDECPVLSMLSGKPCGKGVSLKKYCTSADALLQSGEISSTSMQAAELAHTRPSVSIDEMSRLERGLSFTSIANDLTSSGYEDASVSHSYCSRRGDVDVVATGMDPLTFPKMIPKESMATFYDRRVFKSEVVENDRVAKEISNLQAFHSQSPGGEMSVPGVKANKSREHEPHSRSDAIGPAWQVSPSRGHSVLASPTRLGETISLDSLSSHGGSSSSGSPLALEAFKEGRVSSPGDLMMSKGSPYSVSSRSMGSVSGYDNAVNALLSPTSSNESPSQHWQSNTRRSDELSLGRVHNGHESFRSGGSSHRKKADGMNSFYATTGNLFRGNYTANGNGHGNLIPSGNLLVGGANGDVLSYGGVTKGIVKQERTRQGTCSVDQRLMKRALATLDSEEIKNAGNEYYKAGHFSEALTLYDKAVALCPSNAVYRSSRAAALSSLERLGEAVKECEEAIRLDSSYARAHQHAASLYIRLGIIESAKQHLRDAGHVDLIEVQRLQIVEKHISRCIEARKSEDWHSVIKESDAAVVAGADSAPQIFGFKAEALLRLQKLQQADSVCNVAQKIESSLMDLSIGSPNAYLYLTRAQVNMALGRFDEAVSAAEAGVRVEPNNAIANALLRKARTVAEARATGNDLFKAGRLFEALASYAEGLESDPTNAVLLCNRAACRLKLGQWEKAVEDCDAALKAQSNYTKARLRRARCLTKLERWEDALQDYEALKRELPSDAEVDRGLFDVQVAMKKSRGEEIRGMKFGGDVEEVTTEEQFREAVGSAGLSVVQFITRWSHRCQELSPFMDDLCRRHPCVNFVKVDVEEFPYLARIESISFIPTFKIYKDGQKLKEIIGPSQQSLEYAVKHYSL